MSRPICKDCSGFDRKHKECLRCGAPGKRLKRTAEDTCIFKKAVDEGKRK